MRRCVSACVCVCVCSECECVLEAREGINILMQFNKKASWFFLYEKSKKSVLLLFFPKKSVDLEPLDQWIPNFFMRGPQKIFFCSVKHKIWISIEIRRPLEFSWRTTRGPRSRLWETLPYRTKRKLNGWSNCVLTTPVITNTPFYNESLIKQYIHMHF